MVMANSNNWKRIVDEALATRHRPNTSVYRHDLAFAREMSEAQIKEVENRTRTKRSAHELFIEACISMRASGWLPKSPVDHCRQHRFFSTGRGHPRYPTATVYTIQGPFCWSIATAPNLFFRKLVLAALRDGEANARDAKEREATAYIDSFLVRPIEGDRQRVGRVFRVDGPTAYVSWESAPGDEIPCAVRELEILE